MLVARVRYDDADIYPGESGSRLCSEREQQRPALPRHLGNKWNTLFSFLLIHQCQPVLLTVPLLVLPLRTLFFSRTARHPVWDGRTRFGHIAFRSLWPGRAGSDRGSEFRREDVRKPAMDLGRPPKECKRPNGQCDPSTNFFFFGLGTATHSRTSWLNLGAGLADCGGCTLPTTGKLTIILPDHAERGRGRFLRRRRRLLDEERLEPCTGP